MPIASTSRGGYHDCVMLFDYRKKPTDMTPDERRHFISHAFDWYNARPEQVGLPKPYSGRQGNAIFWIVVGGLQPGDTVIHTVDGQPCYVTKQSTVDRTDDKTVYFTDGGSCLHSSVYWPATPPHERYQWDGTYLVAGEVLWYRKDDYR